MEDVFLEAGAAKADACFQEFWSDAAVEPDRPGNLLDIGLCFLTEG